MESGSGNAQGLTSASAEPQTASSTPTTTTSPPGDASNRQGCGCVGATTITIRVTPTTGGQFDLAIAKTETIENLKKVISKKLKVPKERICLLHRDRQLRDGTLQENQLMDGSRLTLLPSVETGLLAQRPEQSVMQALESLNDAQVNDFLSGKAPLNLTMRLGDHMMLIQLQLSTVTPSSSRRSASSKPSTVDSLSTATSSVVDPSPADPTTSTTSTKPTAILIDPLPTATLKEIVSSGSVKEPFSAVISKEPVSTADSKVPFSTTTLDAPNCTTTSKVPASTSTSNDSSSTVTSTDSVPTAALSPDSPCPRSHLASSLSEVISHMAANLAGPKRSAPVAAAPSRGGGVSRPAKSPRPADETAPGGGKSILKSLEAAAARRLEGGATSVAAPATVAAPAAVPACKCETLPQGKPVLDTRALAEASRNLTQTLKQLSSEVLTSRADPAEDARRQGAIIESMHHHGKGVYSGTFSGTLNPALQDRYGRPKRDISTIIHILNDLLCATPQYRRHHARATAAEPALVGAGGRAGGGVRVEAENQATRGKLERLRLVMEERRQRRRARRDKRAAPYTTQWSAHREEVEPERADCEMKPPVLA